MRRNFRPGSPLRPWRRAPRSRSPGAASVRRPARPTHPLPQGPFRVPISTIDWLVSRESPAARYVALRDLLARPAKDLELRKARQALPRDPFVRDVLALLRDRLYPGRSGIDLERKYDGGFWLVHFLAEMGADASLPLLKHGADVLFARWEKTLVAIDRRADPPLDARLFALVLRTLALLGHAEDPRVLSGAEHLSRLSPQGMTDTGKLLLLLATISPRRRTDPMERAIGFLVARAEDALAGPREGEGEERAGIGFPTGDESDLLELLWALSLLGVPRKPPLERALALLAAKADHRARWTLERALRRLPVVLERPGELSRWVTLRALAVVQHFSGLSIEGAKASRKEAAL